MTTVTLEEIKKDLSGYLHRVRDGETLAVLEANKPVAEIKPISLADGEEPTLRPAGLCAGEFQVPEDFDAPLPESIARLFEGL